LDNGGLNMPEFKAWSFSSREMFNTCPRQFHEIRILKSIPYVQNEHALWGERVHKAFEAAMLHGTPLPHGMEMWQRVAGQFGGLTGEVSAEQRMAIDANFQPTEYFAKNVWCRGDVDALWVNGKVAKAVDWKTGKRKPNSDQLALMALLVFHHHPEIEEVRTMFVWLKTYEQDRKTYYRKDIGKMWEPFLHDVKRMMLAHEKDEWIPKTSGLCNGWCQVKTCEFQGKRRNW